jgi:O-antigen/teichoic acid export membrane protein
VTGSRLQEPQVPVKSVAGESANARGRFSLGRMLSFDPGRVQQKLIPWAMKGGLALLDQGIFAGSNFVMSILLARWLSPEQYGMYAVAFAVLLFLLNFHQGLLLEPMLVFGSSVYRGCLRGYVKALLLLHLGISLVMVLGLFSAAAVISKLGQASNLPGALVAVAFAAPTVLLLWLVKRTFYLKLSPAPSAGAAILYCILILGGLDFLYQHHRISPLSAFLLMGLGSLCTSILLLAYLASRLSPSQNAPSLADTWRRHWRYGRWALGANAMMWVPINAFYPLLSRFSGMAQAGELKALMNFAAPMLQACAALHTLMLPYAARVLQERGRAGISVILRRMTLLCVSCAVPYWAVLLLFQGPAFRMLYSGRYTEVAYLLPVVALASLAGSAFFGPSIVLRSMESPGLIFAAVSVSSCVAVAIGIPLTRAWGLRGAVWSIAMSEALAFVAAVVFVRRKASRTSETDPTLLTLPANGIGLPAEVRE